MVKNKNTATGDQYYRIILKNVEKVLWCSVNNEMHNIASDRIYSADTESQDFAIPISAHSLNNGSPLLMEIMFMDGHKEDLMLGKNNFVNNECHIELSNKIETIESQDLIEVKACSLLESLGVECENE